MHPNLSFVSLNRKSPIIDVSTVTPGWKLMRVELWNQNTNSGCPTLSLRRKNYSQQEPLGKVWSSVYATGQKRKSIWKDIRHKCSNKHLNKMNMMIWWSWTKLVTIEHLNSQMITTLSPRLTCFSLDPRIAARCWWTSSSPSSPSTPSSPARGWWTHNQLVSVLTPVEVAAWGRWWFWKKIEIIPMCAIIIIAASGTWHWYSPWSLAWTPLIYQK